MADILIVDDEIGVRELLSEVLQDEGYCVSLAENAAQARDLHASKHHDLVLLDIWMPDMDGVSLLKEWVANQRLTAPVIMMSGHATIETAVEATRIGAIDFLEKPITLQRLLKTISAGLARGRSAINIKPIPGAVANTTVPEQPVARMPDPVPEVPVAEQQGLLGDISLDQPLREARDEFERIYFEYHLARENHSMTRVSEKTGLERTHLYRKLKQLGLQAGRRHEEN